MTSYNHTKEVFAQWMDDICVVVPPLGPYRSVSIRVAIGYFLCQNPQHESHREKLEFDFGDVWLFVDVSKWNEIKNRAEAPRGFGAFIQTIAAPALHEAARN